MLLELSFLFCCSVHHFGCEKNCFILVCERDNAKTALWDVVLEFKIYLHKLSKSQFQSGFFGRPWLFTACLLKLGLPANPVKLPRAPKAGKDRFDQTYLSKSAHSASTTALPWKSFWALDSSSGAWCRRSWLRTRWSSPRWRRARWTNASGETSLVLLLQASPPFFSWNFAISTNLIISSFWATSA